MRSVRAYEAKQLSSRRYGYRIKDMHKIVAIITTRRYNSLLVTAQPKLGQEVIYLQWMIRSAGCCCWLFLFGYHTQPLQHSTYLSTSLWKSEKAKMVGEAVAGLFPQKLSLYCSTQCKRNTKHKQAWMNSFAH
jgi:hypothetical protein